MADLFDFTNPLQGLEEPVENKDFQEPRLGNSKDFNFSDPLNGLTPKENISEAELEENKNYFKQIPKYISLGATQIVESISKIPSGIYDSIYSQALEDIKTDAIGSKDGPIKRALTSGSGPIYEWTRSSIEKEVGLRDSMLEGRASVLLGSKIMEPKDRIESLRALNKLTLDHEANIKKETNAYRKKSSKRYKDAGLNETEISVVGGVSSLVPTLSMMAAGFATKNPKIAFGAVPMFTAMSYTETFESNIADGVPIRDAIANAKISAGSEFLTEMLPTKMATDAMTSFLKGNKQNIKKIALESATILAAETAAEEVNTLAQSISNAYFDMNDDLRIAYDNKDNPFYEGPTMAEIMADRGYHTLIGSLVAGGGMVTVTGGIQLAPEIKTAIQNLGEEKGKPVYDSYKTIIQNVGLEKIATEKAAVRMMEEDVSSDKNLDPNEILAEELLKVEHVGKKEVSSPVKNAQNELNNINNELDILNSEETFDSYELIEDQNERQAKVLEDTEKENQLKIRQKAIDAAVKYLTKGDGANFTFTEQQVQELIQAELESAELMAIDPSSLSDEAKNNNSNLIRQNQARINNARNVNKEKLTLTERIEANFEKPREQQFNFVDPLTPAFQKKVAGNLTSEIDLELSPTLASKTQNLNFLLEKEVGMISPTLNINNIKNDSYDQRELDLTKELIVDSRTFDESLTGEPNSDQKFYKLRDFNPEESVNTSKSIIDLSQAGMPIEIFTDLSFMGVHTKDNRFKTFQEAYGTYMPTIEGVTFSPMAGVSNLNFQNVLGSKLQLRSTMAHEMGHHIDFTIGRNLSVNKNILSPVTSDSPLFVLPSFKYNEDSSIFEIEDGTGGDVINEAFAIFNTAETGGYYNGGLMRYPLNELISMGDKMTPAMEQMIKAEVFGQFHELYYTNRALLEEKAPTALSLIEELNDAISVDGTTEKNKGVQLAFQSPRAQRGVTVQDRGTDNGATQPVDTVPETSRRVVGPEGPQDGDRVRPEIPELKQVKTTGQVVGAPEGFDSKQKVGALRRKMKGLAEEGKSAKFWYEQSGEALLNITNNNKEDADKLAQVIAITSPGTPVNANFNYALQAYYQYKAGQPIRTGRFPTEMSKKVLDVFEGREWGGRKTNEFYNNIMRVIDPTRTQGVTVDVWMVRAFGFDNDAPTDAQYSFVENEVQKITEQLGWEPQQVQAAIWTAQKARDEGTDVNAAGFNYANALEKSLGQISYESIPGKTSGHMPEMFNAPYEQLQEYHVAMSKALQDENGGDFISNRLGMLSPRIVEAPGFFEGKVSPGSQTMVAAPKIYKAEKDQYATLEPAAEDIIKAYSAALGILLKQDGVGYHRPFVQKGIAKSKLNGMELDIGRPFTEAETQAVAEAMERESGVKDYNPIGTSRGASLINFSYLNISNVKFKTIVNKAVDSVQFENNEDVAAGQFATNAGYLPNNWGTNKNGEGHIQSIRGISPDLQRRVSDIVRELKPRVDEVDQTFSEKYGWTRDESINSEFNKPAEPSELPVLEQKVTQPDFDIYETLTSNDASALFNAVADASEIGVDKLDRLKRFEQSFSEFLSPKELKKLSVIDKTDTYHGKVKYGLDKAVKETKGINEFLAEKNISLETFNKFLKSLHAPERNQKINDRYTKELPDLEVKLLEAMADKNTEKQKISTLKGQITKRKNVLAKYQDSGSGIETAKAIKNLSNLGIDFNETTMRAKANNETGKNLLKAFDMFNKYQQETINIYRDQDLVSEETIEDWDASYKYYVPLVGFAVDTVTDNYPRGTGGGVSVYGREVMEAKGRTTESGPPFQQGVFRRQAAVVRGEKNYIDKSLAEMIKRFPDERIWRVRGVKQNERPHPWDGTETKIGFKEDGKQKFIVIRDERLAKGLDSWGNSTIGPIINILRGMTGMLSSLYTSLAPEFILTNFFRDYPTGYFNLLAEQEIAGGRAQNMDLGKAFKPKNMAKTMRELKDGYVTGKLESKNKEAYELFDAFQKYGGQTGYVNAKDIDQISKDMEILSGVHSGKRLDSAKQTFKSAFSLVENLNNTVENTARFAVFKEYINASGGINGASKQDFQDAAVLAKNLTINFNRSGKAGPIVNAAYVFANASVQGSVNLLRGMVPFAFKGGELQWVGISKAKQRVLGGLVSLGALVEFYSMLVSDEDEDGKLLIDKIPAHERERFMIIPIPGVKYQDGKVKFNKYSRKYTIDGKPFALAIPLPYGYNIFYNLGRMGMAVASKPFVGYQRMSPQRMAIDISGVIAGSFSPVGVGYSKEQGFDFIKTAVPSVAKPLYESRVNEKWTGAPVYKEQFPMSAKKPMSSQKLKNTNEFYREFTTLVNRTSGGGEFDPGTFDISPDKVKFYLQAYLGGMYTTAERTASLSSKFYDNVVKGIDHNIANEEIPFVRVLTAEPQEYVDAGFYYKNKEKIQKVVGEYENYKKLGTRAELEDYKNRTGFDKRYLRANALVKRSDAQLTALRKREKTISKLKYKDEAKYLRIMEEVQEKTHDTHLRFSRDFDKIFGKGAEL